MRRASKSFPKKGVATLEPFTPLPRPAPSQQSAQLTGITDVRLVSRPLGRFRPSIKSIITPKHQLVLEEKDLRDFVVQTVDEAAWKAALAVAAQYSMNIDPVGAHYAGAGVQAYNGKSRYVREGGTVALEGSEAAHIGVGTIHVASGVAQSVWFARSVKHLGVSDRSECPTLHDLMSMQIAHDGMTVLVPAFVNRAFGKQEPKLIRELGAAMLNTKCIDPDQLERHMVFESSKAMELLADRWPELMAKRLDELMRPGSKSSQVIQSAKDPANLWCSDGTEKSLLEFLNAELETPEYQESVERIAVEIRPRARQLAECAEAAREEFSDLVTDDRV